MTKCDLRWKWENNDNFEVSEYNGWLGAEIEADSQEDAKLILAQKIKEQNEYLYANNKPSFLIEDCTDMSTGDIYKDMDLSDKRVEELERNINDVVLGNNNEYKINEFCLLKNIDNVIQAEFKIIPEQTYIATINSKDWNEIVIAIINNQKRAFAEISEFLNNKLENGFVG